MAGAVNVWSPIRIVWAPSIPGSTRDFVHWDRWSVGTDYRDWTVYGHTLRVWNLAIVFGRRSEL